MRKGNSQYAPKAGRRRNLGNKNIRNGRRATGAAAQSIFEPLEDRRLMSTSIALSNGVLTLTGDSTQDSRLIATLDSDGRIHATTSGGKAADFTASSVKSIKMTAGGGDNYFYLSTDISAPVTITTGDGNNSISGGGGDNTITAGDGKNWINTRGKDNYVKIGDGDSTVTGGSGNDTIIAGNGNDLLDGASGGNDSITSGNGSDTIYGQAGDDTIIAGNGNDSINGGLGNDRMVAGTGLSTFVPGSGTNYIVLGNPKSTVVPSAGKNTVVNANGTIVADPTNTPSKPKPVTTWTAHPAGSVASGSPQAVIELLAPAPYVGIAIDVRGSASSLGAGSPITANYQWDFGDVGGEFNQLPGFNASHIYAKPGTYTISLTVTNENGKSSTATTQLTIGSGNRKQIFVDSVGGNDNNSGTSQSSPIRSIAKACTLVGNNTEILFKRGETFVTTQTLMAPYTNVVWGAYGSGDKPVIEQVGRGKPGVLISTQDASAGVTIRDIALDTTGMESDPRNGSGEAMGIVPRGADIAVYNVTFLHAVYAINANGNYNGLTVMDCDSPNAQGLQGYFIWSEGDNLTVVNNTVNGSIHEHVIRTSTTEHQLIAGNNFVNNDGKGCIEIHDGSYAWIAGNDVTNGDIRVGPLGLWGESPSSSTDYAVIEGNQVNNNNIHVYPGAHHVSIRNNVIRRDGSVMIQITAHDSAGRYVSDVQILNNTGINNIGSGKFLQVDSHTYGIILVNNLLIQPNLSTAGNAASPVNVDESDLSSFTLIDGNVWPSPTPTKFAGTGVNYVGTSYVAASYKTPSQWNAMTPVGTDFFSNVTINGSTFAPSSSSTAATAGRHIGGVFYDFNYKLRPSGQWTAGAVQL